MINHLFQKLYLNFEKSIRKFLVCKMLPDKVKVGSVYANKLEGESQHVVSINQPKFDLKLEASALN